MEFSEVCLSYLLFTNTNKITKISQKKKKQPPCIVPNNTIMD
jgi:hypothetical protein